MLPPDPSPAFPHLNPAGAPPPPTARNVGSRLLHRELPLAKEEPPHLGGHPTCPLMSDYRLRGRETGPLTERVEGHTLRHSSHSRVPLRARAEAGLQLSHTLAAPPCFPHSLLPRQPGVSKQPNQETTEELTRQSSKENMLAKWPKSTQRDA